MAVAAETAQAHDQADVVVLVGATVAVFCTQGVGLDMYRPEAGGTEFAVLSWPSEISVVMKDRLKAGEKPVLTSATMRWSVRTQPMPELALVVAVQIDLHSRMQVEMKVCS